MFMPTAKSQHRTKLNKHSLIKSSQHNHYQGHCSVDLSLIFDNFSFKLNSFFPLDNKRSNIITSAFVMIIVTSITIWPLKIIRKEKTFTHNYKF